MKSLEINLRLWYTVLYIITDLSAYFDRRANI